MTDTVKLLSEKRDPDGHVVAEVKQHFSDDKLFSTVWTNYWDTKQFMKVVFATPQDNFNCDFWGFMTVKSFSEQRDIKTGQIYKRTYETPDGSTLSRDYLTGQCTTHRKDGSTVTHDTAMLQKMLELAGSVKSF